MAGLFRRLRLRKPKEEGEEAGAGEPVGEEASGDPDIYPHRAPEVDGDPDIVGEPEPAETDDAESEFGPTSPSTAQEMSSPEGAESQASAETPALTPAFDGPSLELPLSIGPPPRLPEADVAAGGSSHRPLAGSTRCFLCGSEMSGSFCPTCRMTWND
ncbi:MAG: hypothetical protein L3K18_03895 [Thermoplasmata archaeon]|nr:hypothetical protein [Thermoplasmata archaeon]